MQCYFREKKNKIAIDLDCLVPTQMGQLNWALFFQTTQRKPPTGNLLQLHPLDLTISTPSDWAWQRSRLWPNKPRTSGRSNKSEGRKWPVPCGLDGRQSALQKKIIRKGLRVYHVKGRGNATYVFFRKVVGRPLIFLGEATWYTRLPFMAVL